MLNSKKKCNFAALFVFIQKHNYLTPKTHIKHTMVHLTNTSRSATFLLGTAMLMLFLFCAPMHAQTPTFKSTSSYRIANPNYSAQQLDPTTIGHQTYRSTIYTPFGSSTPSSNNPSGNSGSGGSGDPDDDVGIPGWADTPSEPLPIGDSTPLFGLAAAMIAIIWIRQRKQQRLTTQTQSTNNNNPTQHMTTRKQTYQSLRQKLFLLLAFVCIAGQVSGQQSRRLYFRPSTILVSNNSGSSTIAWAKASTGAWFPMLGNKDDVYANKKWHYLDSYTSVKIYDEDQSRFLAYTADTDTYKFAFYRVNDGTGGAIYTDLLKYVTQQGSTANIDKGVFNCIPNNDWYTKSSQYWNSQMISLPDLGAHNLICIKEGSWTSYYYAYYIDNTVNLYFANTTNWDTPIFARGKDVYSYKHSSTNITGTKLYYTQLVKGSGIAYTDYAYIDGNTGSWDEQTTLWKDYETQWVAPSTINQNTLENRINSFSKRSAIVKDHCLDNKLFENSTEVNFHVFTPGTNVGDPLTKQSLSNYTDLNHTLTIKNYIYNPQTKSYDNSNAGGYVTYYTHKLTGATTTQRIPEGDGTITVDANSGSTTAAYTAQTVLTAYPKEGYKFHGWYDKDGTLLHDKAEFTWYKVQNYDNEVHARFLPKNVKQFKYRVQTCASGQEFNTTNFDATGGSINVTATDGQSVTISKANGNDNEYQKLYHQDDTQITCTATPNSGYVFVGWWNNKNGQILTNPWIAYAGNMNDLVTARFASIDNVKTQTINIVGSGSATITHYLDHEQSHTTTISKSVTANAWINKDVSLTATPKSGHSFVGWYEGQNLVSKDATYTYTATTARNITAYFAEGTGTTTLTVRAMIYKGTELVRSLEGGTFTMTHSGGIVYKPINKEDKDVLVLNTPVTFAATANDGYEFIAWFNNTKGQFLDNPWIMQNPGNSNTYDKTVTAVFASNQEFAKRQDIKIEGPGTVTANYTFYKDDDKQALTKTTTFHYNSSFVAWSGHNVTLTAEPLAGYEFVGWYDAEDNPIADGVTSNTLTYTATSARTITAKFVSEVNKLTVSVLNYNPEYDKFEEYGYEYNKITLKQGSNVLKESYSSFSHEFNDATSVTLIATPEDGEDGYDFVGWYQNDTLLNKQQNITVNVIGIQAISARFAPKKCWTLQIISNIGGLYSVHHTQDQNFTTYQTAESALDHSTYTYFPFGTTYIKVSPKPITGYKCIGYKVGGSYRELNEVFEFKREVTEARVSSISLNFVRKEDQVVYLNLDGLSQISNDWLPKADTPSKYYAFASNTHNGKILWIEMTKVSEKLHTCTIPGSQYNRLNFVHSTKLDLNGNTTIGLNDLRDILIAENRRTSFLTIPATRYNCYRIQGEYTSDTGDGQPGYIDGWTTPPTQEGDYQLVYIEQTVLDKNNIHEDYRFDKAEAIKKRASTGKDTVSLHIYNKVSDGINGVNNPEVILQRYDGTEWVDIERYMVFGPLRSDKPGVIRMPGRKNTTGEKISVDQGISNIIAEANGDDQACGVWNFVIQQTIDNGNVTAKLLVNETHRYTGNYYIRTTNADGQYNKYTHPNNVMKLSEFAADNSDYSHYFIRYVDINEDGTPTAEAGKHPLVKFAIANDYAVYLNHELMINNDRFTSGICKDDYEDDPFVVNKGGAPNLPADATVRFGWDIKTNRLTRAYIANTTIKNNEYLVVEGEEGNNKIGSPSGDAVYFTDNSNWLYSIDLPDAKAGAKAKVKAKMNGQYQYFMGSGLQDGYETLISGNGTNTYPIRLLYDFKDDRFTTIYRPKSGTINNDVTLSTPLMIEREHNGKATQIVLNTNKITTVEAGQDQFTQPAYAVMTFLESVLADASKTHHEKMFYWISFPFDVRISDVFGLGDYGKYWIMEEYDGAQRAAQGLAQSNWKYITKKSTVLSKNVGYVLCLNYSQILQDKLFNSYGSSDQELNGGKLSLYFPSNGTLSPRDITGNQRIDVNLEEHYNANTAWNHHNWHIIGVPSFADPEFTKIQQDAPFVYIYWHPSDAYAAVSINEVDFQSMHAYMVQYTGDIQWTSVVNNGSSVSGGKSLAAKTDEEVDKKIMLRLELQQAGSTLDKTYVQLRNDKGTKGFDMSLDLTKIINAGANIYSIVDNHEMAGNAIPKEETVLPLGVVITAAGEYTFAMPNGTEGIIVELIDYEQGTCTNLLVGDYTVNMPVGTNNTRFALRLKPDKVATSVEDITSGTNDNNVRKLLIDGVLYLVKDGAVYDAQGHCVR